MKTHAHDTNEVKSRYGLTPTPDHLRLDPRTLDQNRLRPRGLSPEEIASYGDPDADGGFSGQEPARRARPSAAERRRAMVCLEAHLADTGARSDELAQQALDALLRTIPSLEPARKKKPLRSPLRQAQMEQARMWAGSGILPPHVRKKLPVSIAAYISRAVDMITVGSLGLCCAAVQTLCDAVGVCRRTGQRANAMIAAGEIPGLQIERPVNCGPDTDTNVIRFSGALSSASAVRLRKWVANNRWKGRLARHPKEIIGLSETERRPILYPAPAIQEAFESRGHFVSDYPEGVALCHNTS